MNMIDQTRVPETTAGEPIEPSRVPVPSGYMDNLRYRERVAGTGYGRSSGYARDRNYAVVRDEALFRCQ